MENRKDHFKKTLQWVSPASGVVKPWEGSVLDVLEHVKAELRKPQPALSVVEAAEGFCVPGPKIAVSKRYITKGGNCRIPSNELMYFMAGVKIGFGNPEVFLYPLQDQDADCVLGETTIFLRKDGIGAYAEGELFQSKFWLAQFSHDDVYGEPVDPHAKYSTKYYNDVVKTGGVVRCVDQYFCGVDGTPDPDVVQLVKNNNVRFEDVPKLWNGTLTQDMTVSIGEVTFKLVWLVKRKRVAYAKQLAVHVKELRNFSADPQTHLLTLDSKVFVPTTKDVDALKETENMPLDRYFKAIHGFTYTEACDEGFVQYINLTGYVKCDCGFTGWLAGDCLNGFLCDCGATHKNVKAQSAGVVNDCAVARFPCPLSENGHCSHTSAQLCDLGGTYRQTTTVAGHTLLAYGGVFLSYVGCVDGMCHFMPRLTCRVNGTNFTGVIGDFAIVKQCAQWFKATSDTAANLVLRLKRASTFVVDEVMAALVANTCTTVEQFKLKLQLLDYDTFVKLLAEQQIQVSETAGAAMQFLPCLPLSNWMANAIYKLATLKVQAAAKIGDLCTLVSNTYQHYYEDTEGLVFLQDLFDSVEFVPTCISTFALTVNKCARHIKTVCKIFGDMSVCVAEKILAFVLNYSAKTRAIVSLCVDAILQLASACWRIVCNKVSVFAYRTNAILDGMLQCVTTCLNMCVESVTYAGIKLKSYCFSSVSYLNIGTRLYAESSERLGGLNYPSAKTKYSVLVTTDDQPDELVCFSLNTADVHELNGALEPADVEPVANVEGEVVSISGKLVACDEKSGYYYLCCDNGMCVSQPYKLVGGMKKHVTISEVVDVKEVSSERCIVLNYALHPLLDKILASKIPHVIVETDCTLEDVNAVVYDMLLQFLKQLHTSYLEATGSGIPGFDYEEFCDNGIYLFTEDGDYALADTLICSLHPVEDDVVECSDTEDEDDDSCPLDNPMDEWNAAVEEQEAKATIPQPPPKEESSAKLNFTVICGIKVLCMDIVAACRELKPYAVVNTANVRMQHGGGVAGALNRATSGAMQQESDDYVASRGHLAVGDGVKLKGYNLAEYILHVVGPDARVGQHESDLLKCYEHISKTAESGVVLTPLVSAGIFGVEPLKSFAYLLAASTSVTNIVVVVNDSSIVSKLQTFRQVQHILCLDALSCVKLAINADYTLCLFKDTPYSKVDVSSAKVHFMDAVGDTVYDELEKYQPFVACLPGTFKELPNERAVKYASHGVSLAGVFVITDSSVEDCMKSAVANDMKAGRAVDEFISSCVQNNGYANWNLCREPFVFDNCTYEGLLSKGLDLIVNDSLYFYKYTASDKKLSKFSKVGSLRKFLDLKEECVFVYVTVDGVNYTKTRVLVNKTFGDQLGLVTSDNRDISTTVPSAEWAGKQLWVVPSDLPVSDIKATYGVEEHTFLPRFFTMLKKCSGWSVTKIDGFVMFKQSDNNCYVNTALVMCQQLPLRFKPVALQTAYMELKAGSPTKFAALLMTYAGVTFGNMGDVLELILHMQKHLDITGSATITTWCDACGVTDVVLNANDACVYLGALLPDDYMRVNDGVCTCGRTNHFAISRANLPFLILADNPRSVDWPDKANSASVFKAAHFVCVVKKGSFYYKADGGVVTKSSAFMGDCSIISYTNVVWEQDLALVTYTLDGVRHTKQNPDLSQYFSRDGVYYTENHTSDLVAQPIRGLSYTNAYFKSTVVDVSVLNAQIGWNGDSQSMCYTLTQYPDVSGDGVVCDFSLYQSIFKNGAVYRGKRVFWTDKGVFTTKLVKANKLAARSFPGQSLLSSNRYNVLEHEVCINKTVEPVLSVSKPVIEVAGLDKAVTLPDAVLQPGTSKVRVVRNLTVEDVLTVHVKGAIDFVIQHTNELSNYLGLPTLFKDGYFKADLAKYKSKILHYAAWFLQRCNEQRVNLQNHVTYENVRSVLNTPIVRKIRSVFMTFVCLFWNSTMNVENKLAKCKCAVRVCKNSCSMIASLCLGSASKLRNHGIKMSMVLLLLLIYQLSVLIYYYFDVLNSDHYTNSYVQFMKNASGVRTMCDGVIDDYFNNAYDAEVYCNNSSLPYAFCSACLKGVDSVSNYPALAMTQQFISVGFKVDYEIVWLLLEWYLAYLLYTKSFNLIVMLGLLKILVTTSLFDVNFLMLTLQYVVLVLPMSVVLRFYIVIASLYKIFLVYSHVINGCKDVSCLYCYRKNKVTRVECSTVLNGSRRLFYVNANGGVNFCTVHNWNCVNCDMYDTSSTFITPEVAADLSNMYKRTIKATDVASYDVTSVTCKNGAVNFYYTKDGTQCYERLPLNVVNKIGEHSYKNVIKTNELKIPVMYYDATSNMESSLARNACVYYSQVMCRPILRCDTRMVASLGDEASASTAMFDAYCSLYCQAAALSEDRVKEQAKEAKKALSDGVEFDVAMRAFIDSTRKMAIAIEDSLLTQTIYDSVKLAHVNDMAFCVDSFNNFVPTYLRKEHITTYDTGVLIDVGAVHVYPAALKNAGDGHIIWNAEAFLRLSETMQRSMKVAVHKLGLRFSLTLSSVRAHCSLVVTRFTVGGGVKPFFCLKLLIAIAIVLGVMAALLWLLIPRHVNVLYSSDVLGDRETTDFVVIDNGIIRNLLETDLCLSNKFNDFLFTEHARQHVVVYDDNCPVVAAVAYVDIGTFVPNVPGKVVRYRNQLLHYVTQSFKADDGCYTPYNHLSSRDFVNDGCILSAACTRFVINGVIRVFCFDTAMYENSLAYNDLKPHIRYDLHGSGSGVSYIRFPEVLVDSAIRLVRVQAMEYCRYGSCEQSMEGICMSMNGAWVLYNEHYTSKQGMYCGKNALELVFSIVSPLIQPVSVVNVGVSVVLVICLSFVCAFFLYYMLKLRRAFGDYTTLFLVNALCSCGNVALLCFVQAWPWLLVPYSIGYFYVTFYFANEITLVMHGLWLVSFGLVAPLWLVSCYIGGIITKHSFFLLQLFATKKVDLFSNGKLNASFAEAAMQTFLIDKNVYSSLKSSISQEAFTRYLAMYNKYKYYSGAMDTAAYHEAACCFLAKALAMYSENGGRDLLYQPPSCTVTSAVLQAGLLKMTNPTGVIEKCIVKVTCGSMTLNGLWLSNKVICPRHVMCSRDDMDNPDYSRLILRKANHDFTVTKSTLSIRVVGVAMKGALLELTTDVFNADTPKYTFTRVRVGSSFSVLACYNGVPAGAFQVVMRSNGTIKGSFLCGSCGSIGYLMDNGVVHFVYMHQLELPSGTHSGTDLDGVFYGDFEDRQTSQACAASKYITLNIMAWLYGAIINGERWFLKVPSMSVVDFNAWALQNGYESYVETDMLSPFVAKTCVSIEQILGAVRSLAMNGMQGRTILGQSSVEDELTPHDVQRQVMGVVMQSRVRRVTTGLFSWVVLTCCLALLTLYEVVSNTFLQYLPIHMSLSVYSVVLWFVAMCMVFIKHKFAYLVTYVLPALSVLSYVNLTAQRHWLIDMVFVHLEQGYGIVSASYRFTTVAAFIGCLTLLVFMCYRTVNFTYKSVCLSACQLLWWFYNYYVGSETAAYNFIMFFCGTFTNHGGVAFLSLALARLVVYCGGAFISEVVPEIKLVMLVYLVIGYLNTCYFGLFCLLNKCFRLTFGVYNYKVSPQEFRYMNSNGLSAPQDMLQVIKLNIKLAGVGGVPSIAVATMQSKFTDVKCASVVLLNCLQQLRVEANTNLWRYCVKLHNEILESKDTTECFEKFCALLTTLLSLPGAINIDSVCDDLLSDSAVMQAVTSEFHNMSSFIEMENAQKTLDDAIRAGESAQTINQLKKAANIAKAAYQKDAAVARKLERMADAAMTQMYKQARAEDKKAKVISAMQSMLFAMIKRLDNTAVNSVINLARNGCVPLNIFPTMVSNHLCVVVPDSKVWESVISYPILNYAGALWDITAIKDADSKILQPGDVKPTTYDELVWPLVVNATRQSAAIKLQNNELIPTSIRQMSCAAGTEQMNCVDNSIAYYNATGAGKLVLAIVSKQADLKWAKIQKADADSFVYIELEPPCKFVLKGQDGPEVRYLYFVQRLNTLHRGQVLGHLAATIRLQAGVATEYATNSTCLSLVAFAADPRKAYMDFVNNGGQPITNCVKMLTPHTGTGVAISTKPEATLDQETFGGASCCLYCRAYIDHPSVVGTCPYKGKFVQIPTCGLKDPVMFCLKNTVCSVCNMWKSYGCGCDAMRDASIVFQGQNENFLNESGVLV